MGKKKRIKPSNIVKAPGKPKRSKKKRGGRKPASLLGDVFTAGVKVIGGLVGDQIKGAIDKPGPKTKPKIKKKKKGKK